MADNEHSDLGFQQRSGNLLKSSSSGMHIATTMSSVSLPKSSNCVDSMFGTTWDPHVSLNAELKSSAMGSHNPIVLSPYSVGMLGNHIASNNSHSLRYSSDPSFLDPSSKLSTFGSGSFSAMVGSFGLSEYDQINNASCPDYLPTEGAAMNTNLRKVDVHAAMFRSDLQISDEGGSGSSSDAKKRKRAPDCHSDTIHPQFQSGEAEQHNDVSQESIEGDGKKQKMEKNSGTNSRGKSTGKQAKDTSQNEQSAKEDYIHVRARRGQATNSHSLAERVRREKISQRMKYLQDLVPGCDKITGKALMLDEIINYVQSLQRQVEFLSMKLATVNPELNIDIERIMSRDILHAQVGGSSILGFGPGMSSSQIHVSSRGPQAMHCTDSHLQTAPQTHATWDDELQNIIQMGLLSNSAVDSLNGKVGTS